MTLPTVGTFLDRQVTAFEAAVGESPDADYAHFLPAPGHPQFLDVLTELIRVDLEIAWRRGTFRRISSALQRYPVLQAHPHHLVAIAFEEYRQRRLAGDPVVPQDYQSCFGFGPLPWPLIESKPLVLEPL